MQPHTLHAASAKENREVRTAIWKNFPACTNPVRALWFVRSNRSPREVRADICRDVGKVTREKLSLAVVQAARQAPMTGPDWIRRDPFWLWENGIDSRHTLLEASTPRAACPQCGYTGSLGGARAKKAA